MAKTLKGRLKLTPLPPHHPLYSGKFVLGGAVRKPSPESSSKLPKNRGRGLPHQYPWIDSLEDILLPKSPTEDSDE